MLGEGVNEVEVVPEVDVLLEVDVEEDLHGLLLLA